LVSEQLACYKHDMPLLKLDVKFELPMYDGEVNVERLDNWVRQMEVYYSVQQINDDATQIKLASLRLLSLKFHPQMVTGIQHLQTAISSPMDQKCISKRPKTIQSTIKSACAKTTQGARTCAIQKCRKKCTCTRCATVDAKNHASLKTTHL
jgi:hypothetical protein